MPSEINRRKTKRKITWWKSEWTTHRKDNIALATIGVIKTKINNIHTENLWSAWLHIFIDSTKQARQSLQSRKTRWIFHRGCNCIKLIPGDRLPRYPTSFWYMSAASFRLLHCYPYTGYIIIYVYCSGCIWWWSIWT